MHGSANWRCSYDDNAPEPVNLSLDVKSLGHPSKFAGRPEQWPIWYFVSRAYFALNGILDKEQAEAVEQHVGPIVLDELGPEWKKRSLLL